MPGPRDAIAKLRSLAAERGYTVERALTKGRYRLIPEDGSAPPLGPRGVNSWRAEEAIRFLKKAGRR